MGELNNELVGGSFKLSVKNKRRGKLYPFVKQ